MNDDATDYATNLPVTLDNEATQYDAVFAFANNPLSQEVYNPAISS